MGKPRKMFLTMLVIFLMMLPLRSFADDSKNTDDTGAHPQQWGISIWGLSYHFRRDTDFNQNNWGIGIRHSSRPEWKWLGKDQDNRFFVEIDALKNSYRGLVLPLSFGAEYKIKNFSDNCRLFGIVSLTFAYYQNPEEKISEFKWGPIPGLALDWGNLKYNLILIPSPSKRVMSAIAASITVNF